LLVLPKYLIKMNISWICQIFLLVSLTLLTVDCGKKGKETMEKQDEGDIDLDQDVTNERRPQDTAFLSFEKNWRKFISPAPELLRPVVVAKQPVAWTPIIISDCKFSAEAGGPVAQVEISWQAAPVEQPMRFDLAVHYQGFEKNYYSTVFPVEEQKRFNLPSNSRFVADPEAMLLTGPSMFPKVVQFKTANLPTTNQVAANRNLKAYTLRLRDLGPGLSYRIRMCTFNREVWTPAQTFTFTSPICPNDKD
jgi:hypothetical protein